jgi:hypothetical protein
MKTKLVALKCEVHAMREAAARCTVCSHHYCRECIQEHEGRMVCGNCLSLKSSLEPKHFAGFKEMLVRLVMALASAALLWGAFWCIFTIGSLLPAEVYKSPVERAGRKETAR